MKKERIRTEWEVWTYDVWGNARDGYEVNDRSCQDRNYPLTLTVSHHNVGTEHEFASASPTDAQLRKIFGVRCQIDTDGDDLWITVTRSSDSYPIGELHCTSHESLSPIRATVARTE